MGTWVRLFIEATWPWSLVLDLHRHPPPLPSLPLCFCLRACPWSTFSNLISGPDPICAPLSSSRLVSSHGPQLFVLLCCEVKLDRQLESLIFLVVVCRQLNRASIKCHDRVKPLSAAPPSPSPSPSPPSREHSIHRITLHRQKSEALSCGPVVLYCCPDQSFASIVACISCLRTDQASRCFLDSKPGCPAPP
ncbi:hypothetical protein VTL71DRAFT_11074 [Oculimacula yallundae]|uniref:Uncharacterized protein n=1 Tax=Oculimacula yallundae TaxID=86028 RepID=A0ABR4CWM8_9HELO